MTQSRPFQQTHIVKVANPSHTNLPPSTSSHQCPGSTCPVGLWTHSIHPPPVAVGVPAQSVDQQYNRQHGSTLQVVWGQRPPVWSSATGTEQKVVQLSTHSSIFHVDTSNGVVMVSHLPVDTQAMHIIGSVELLGESKHLTAASTC